MRILDAHAHLGTWADFLVPQPGADWLVDVMTREGIEAAGVSHLMAVGHDVATGNQLALDAAGAHPGRLYAWLVFSPHHPAELGRLTDQLSDPRVWGLKLHPDVHRVALDDPRYEPAWALAAAQGVPILTHTQTGARWSDPALAAALASRWPEVDVLMGHGGLDVDGLLAAARLARSVSNLHLETCSSRLTRHWLARLVDEAGAESVLFGSDAVFLDPRTAVGRLRATRVSEDDRALLAGGNLARILGPRLARAGTP